jgi:hypothetical protein
VWTSPSSIALSFVVSQPVSAVGQCGTTTPTSGTYTEVTPSVYTEGWQRASFTGTSTAWGNALAITGLHQTLAWQCNVVVTDILGGNSATSNTVSGNTTTLSTIPVTVGAISPLTRLNDQFNAANGMAQANYIKAASALTTASIAVNETVQQTTTGATAVVQVALPVGSTNPLVIGAVTGSPNSSNTWVGQTNSGVFSPSASPVAWYMQGDTETGTIGNDGNFYGFCHDCDGIGGVSSNVLGWLEWNPAHTVATQLSGVLMSGCTAGSACGAVSWTDGGTWESWGIQSVRGQIYMPLLRCWPSGLTYCGDFNMSRSPDHLVHSVTAGDQYAQGLGPNSILVSGFDTPVAPAVMPNNPIPGSINSSSGTTNGAILMNGLIQTCEDESINCTPQANNDGYLYSWCTVMPTNNASGPFALCRIRVEDMPLMDGSKWSYYTGTNSADDGIYDSNWTFTATSSSIRQFGYTSNVNGFWLGDLPMSQFIPSFNRFLTLNTLDNVIGGAVVLYDSGPYPWGTQTAIGQVGYNPDVWPGFFPSFGQINPGSYLQTSSSPLGAIVQLTLTGTINGYDSGTQNSTANGCGYGADNCANSSYSPFIAKMTLTPRLTVPPKSQVSAVNRMDTHILNGLDVFYDFRSTSSWINMLSLPDLSPNDPTGIYNNTSSNYTNAGSWPAYFSQRGMLFSFPTNPETISGLPQSPYGIRITTPYTKSLTAFTAIVAFEHYGADITHVTSSGEVILTHGALGGSTSFTIERNGTSLNSWEAVLDTTTIGPFTLATDGSCTTYPSGTSWATFPSCAQNYQALVVRWDGTNVTVYSSAQIPSNGYTQPLTTLASGTYTGSISGTLMIGEGPTVSTKFQGTMSDLLVFSRKLSDAELVHEMNALRYDMTSRGISLP